MRFQALSLKKINLLQGDNMKKTILRLVAATLLLLALGTTTAVADGVPLPMCWPERCPGQ
jgi:hypothetical protein